MKQPIPLIERPRAAGTPQNAAASSLPHPRHSQQLRAAEDPHQSKQPLPSFDRAAPHSGSSPQSSILLPVPIDEPRAAGAPPKNSSVRPPPSQQLRAARAPHKAASSLTRAASSLIESAGQRGTVLVLFRTCSRNLSAEQISRHKGSFKYLEICRVSKIPRDLHGSAIMQRDSGTAEVARASAEVLRFRRGSSRVGEEVRPPGPAPETRRASYGFSPCKYSSYGC